MSHKVYISYVVQSKEAHSHYSEMLTVAPAQYAVYTDITSQKVVEWANAKQQTLLPGEAIVILNYFPISNHD